MDFMQDYKQIIISPEHGKIYGNLVEFMKGDTLMKELLPKSSKSPVKVIEEQTS